MPDIALAQDGQIRPRADALRNAADSPACAGHDCATARVLRIPDPCDHGHPEYR